MQPPTVPDDEGGADDRVAEEPQPEVMPATVASEPEDGPDPGPDPRLSIDFF